MWFHKRDCRQTSCIHPTQLCICGLFFEILLSNVCWITMWFFIDPHYFSLVLNQNDAKTPCCRSLMNILSKMHLGKASHSILYCCGQNPAEKSASGPLILRIIRKSSQIIWRIRMTSKYSLKVKSHTNLVFEKWSSHFFKLREKAGSGMEAYTYGICMLEISPDEGSGTWLFIFDAFSVLFDDAFLIRNSLAYVEGARRVAAVVCRTLRSICE